MLEVHRLLTTFNTQHQPQRQEVCVGGVTSRATCRAGQTPPSPFIPVSHSSPPHRRGDSKGQSWGGAGVQQREVPGTNDTCSFFLEKRSDSVSRETTMSAPAAGCEQPWGFQRILDPSTGDRAASLRAMTLLHHHFPLAGANESPTHTHFHVTGRSLTLHPRLSHFWILRRCAGPLLAHCLT